MIRAAQKYELSFTRRQSLSAALAGVASFGLGLGLKAARAADETLPVEGVMPPLATGGLWLNSAPLTREALRGKVVLVDFWTYSCINCQRTLPYVRDWHAKYHDRGLVVIGVHTPEFAYEKDRQCPPRGGETGPRLSGRARQRLRKLARLPQSILAGVLFHRCSGPIRRRHFGEGEYEGNEAAIRQLLSEAGHAA